MPDVRRLNEAAAVHDASGINVLVQRPGVEWNGHGTEELAQKIGQHPTLCYAAEALSGLHTGHWHPRSGELYLRSVVDAVVDAEVLERAHEPEVERVPQAQLRGDAPVEPAEHRATVGALGGRREAEEDLRRQPAQ